MKYKHKREIVTNIIKYIKIHKIPGNGIQISGKNKSSVADKNMERSVTFKDLGTEDKA
jgi:hypothetical protein